MNRVRIIFFCFLSVLPFAGIAEDDAEKAMPANKEAMNDNMVDSHMLRMNSPVIGYQSLMVAGQEIAATYLEETLGERFGAVILFHDKGEQFESQGVVTPLRHQLPEYGWSTLTLALDYPVEPNILLSTSLSEVEKEGSMSEPITSGAASADSSSSKQPSEALPPVSNQQRIETALSSLQAKDIKRVVFIGHGVGGSLAIELLDKIKIPISALILVGTPALKTDEVFKTFGQPLFDIYGAQDLAGVNTAVNHRKILMKRSGNIQYQARQIEGANHVFYGLQPTLVSTIRGWLKTMFPESEDQ